MATKKVKKKVAKKKAKKKMARAKGGKSKESRQIPKDEKPKTPDTGNSSDATTKPTSEIKSQSTAPASEAPAIEKDPIAIRTQLERDACRKYTDGDIPKAIETLNQAITVDGKWYHYFCKAHWLYEEGDIIKASKALENGRELYPKSSFWFYYLEADLLCRLVQVNMFADIDKSNRTLTSASSLLEAARRLHDTWDSYGYICESFDIVPDFIRSAVFSPIDMSNVNTRLISFRGDIERYRHSLVLTKEIKRVHDNVQAAESRIDSERIKTIELLSIFTAIISFVIITGTSVLKMGAFEEAMPILGGLALVLIAFVSAVSLFTTRYISLKAIVLDVKLWMFVVLVITIGGLICYSVNKTAEQNKPIGPKISTEAPVPSSISVN